MLAISTQNQQGIFEKVLRGKDGRLYTVQFVVINTRGHIRGRVLSAVPVSELDGTFTNTKTSSCPQINGCTQIPDDFFVFEYSGIVSPFVSKFAFFTSQMTRAPSEI